MSRGENQLIDDLNAFGCTRETLRKRIQRATSTGDYLSDDLARDLGCSVRTIHRWAAQGSIWQRPVGKPGRRVHRKKAR